MNNNFYGHIPKESGYYWYVDKEYPQPVIGFVSGNWFFDSRNNEVTRFVGRWIFIGPMIPQFDCKDVNIIGDD